jgi:hypothetical protein
LALKIAGDPAAPDTVAVAVCVPEVVPSVQSVLAAPLASVATDVGLSWLLAAAVAQLTVHQNRCCQSEDEAWLAHGSLGRIVVG